MLGRVWVLVESSGGRLLRPGLELLARARRLAGAVEAVHWGGDTEAVAAQLGRHGASALHAVGGVGDALPGAPVAAALAARALGPDPPDALFFAATCDQRDIAGRLSARLDRPLVSDVVDVDAGEDGRTLGVVSEHAGAGGRVLVRRRITAPAPHLLVFRPASPGGSAAEGRPAPAEGPAIAGGPPPTAEPAADGLPPAVVRLGVPSVPCAVVRGRRVGRPSDARLDGAAVVVAGGRGLGGREQFAMVEELARLLGGAPAATGAAVGAGWAPPSWQVGQTGARVRPLVYLAFGVSGASQHAVGMWGARHVVAVNRDRDAPILSLAALGVVGDAASVLARLVAAVRARRAPSAP